MTIDLERMDKREGERVEDLAKAADSGQKVTLSEIFASSEIPKFLEEKPITLLNSFRTANPTLPLNCLLYRRPLVHVCSLCDCNENPDLIKPYLERGLILPILTEGFTEYNPQFVKLVSQYPHIGVAAWMFFRQYSITSDVSPQRFVESIERILEELSKKRINKQRKRFFQGYLTHVMLWRLIPVGAYQAQILHEIEDCVKQDNLDSIPLLAAKTILLDELRMASELNAIPQVSPSILSSAIGTLRKMKIPVDSDISEELEQKKWAVGALNLDYDPAIKIEDYLDIILPRRQKINSLINEIVLRGSRKNLAKINDEIWEINREISSSKRLEIATFITNFIFGNTKIMFAMLAGAFLGYSTGDFVGCGVGSIGGLASGIVGDVIARRKSLKIPKYPKKTLEWIETKLEGPEEKLLSVILSKNTKAIQVWGLRKKIKK